MNFYKHHLGDYAKDTSHLGFLEDAAYTRALRVYYLREKPLPIEICECERLIRAVTRREKEVVTRVLNEFFELREDGWHNKRADEEIQQYQLQASTNRRIARERTVKRIVPRNVDEAESKRPPNHKPEPLTKNQEPEKSKATTGAAAPDPVKEEIWKTGKELLAKNGFDVKLAGGFLGKLCKEYGQILVLQAVRDCVATTPAEPHTWLMARCQERRKGNGKFNPILANKRNLDASLAAARVGTGPAPPILDVVPDAIHVEFSRSSDD